MVKTEYCEYGTYGKCVKLSNGGMELLVTLDIGPHIIRVAKPGGENVMLEDTADKVNKQEFAEVFAEKFGSESGVWHIYGGHRLWTSPEYLPRTYFPDNVPVECEEVPNGIKVKQVPQQWTQIACSMTVTMAENENKVEILHEVKNVGAWSIQFAPWALSVLAPGGFEVMPMPRRKTGLLSNRKIVLWDYTKMNDPRVTWGDKYITLRQDPNAREAFKFGIDSQHCWAAYFNHGDVFIKQFDTDPEAEYPDGGCNFETYTSEVFLEMESLGALKTVQPEESAFHREQWTFASDVACPENDEEAITRALQPYLPEA